MDFEDIVRRKLKEILSGEITPRKMPGSTTELAALALILDHPPGLTSLNSDGCWRYLRDQDIVLVRQLRAEFQDEIIDWEATAKVDE
ncbi:hypothetical protein NOF55_16455 [Rhizobiaceae bacterium BDR2-2]|uniref:Uncharacterized protein n=1 Tax=Ectorhizobium quercum TaxID=2965071 RepID=A0AAE3N202_9HYPH|nr:hypothetical protein [Ectorhizobium quercum]MCX8996255.1 hypothetical protein [Ectorhizobium quercum]MCX8998706.1 hypothetical protein [Ectorhizobium quercum]